MYISKLSELVNGAVMDCIAYGRGRARVVKDGVVIDIEADWLENEMDIEITIFEACAIRFTFTERISAEFR